MANSYATTGTAIPTSSPTSDDVCVVSGYLVDVQDKPLAGMRIQVRNLYYPLALGQTKLVLRERLEVTADREGYFEFEALRGSRLKMNVPNLDGFIVFEGNVPDVSACDFLDIFLPYVVSIAWDDASVALDVGEGHTPTLTGTLSDGTTCDVTSAVETSSSNESVLEPSGSGYLGLAAGSATLSVDSFDFDSLAISQAVDETVVKRLNLPTTALPSALVVTVS